MNLEKYVDPLPIPQIMKTDDDIDGVPFYKMTMSQFKQKLHRDLPPTTVWGFEGTYPGPTFDLVENQPIKVQWINKLPSKHLLPVDTTIHGAGPDQPRVRTVIHLHGGVVKPESDGYPEAWFTRDYQQVGPYFVQKIYDYPNMQRPATMWYHAHALGITRLNVYAGIVGLYFIRSEDEEAYNLPRGSYEIPLLIQDKSFKEDGSLYYPSQPEEPIPEVDPSIIPDFFGDTILVNGKVWPYLEVEPRKYRFKMVNGSNARFYRMRLSSGQPFYQIGTGGGFLEKPVKVCEIILAPAQRADVIIDFSREWGQKIILTNDAPTSFPNGTAPDPETTGQIMQFNVCLPLSKRDFSVIPCCLSSIEWLKEEQADRVRNLPLVRTLDQYGRPKLLLDGKVWDDPISEEPKLDSTEIWTLINLTNATHPIHVHLVHFQILDRQPFDASYYEETGEIKTTGPPIPPELNERGWIDTVRANPGEITRIIMRFTPFSGLYVWHCHLMEHEDWEMMRPYMVINHTHSDKHPLYYKKNLHEKHEKIKTHKAVFR